MVVSWMACADTVDWCTAPCVCVGRVTFIGDDTWTRLFPDTFARSYPFPSFDVADLDTVDAGVAALLPLELQGRVADAARVYDSMAAEAAAVGQDTAPSDIVVAHMLGVDHTGHTCVSSRAQTCGLWEHDACVRQAWVDAPNHGAQAARG